MRDCACVRASVRACACALLLLLWLFMFERSGRDIVSWMGV